MRTRNASINIATSLISLGITTVLAFVVSKIFLSNLGVEVNGINSLYGNIIAVLSIAELGIAGAISYNLYKPIADNDTETIATIMKFYRKCYRIIGCIILVLAFAISFFVNGLIKDATVTDQFIQITFLLYAINTSCSYFFAYNRSLFYAHQQNYYTTIIDFIINVIKNILQIVALLVWQNYIVFLIINIIGTYSNNIIVYFLARKKYKHIDIKNARADKELEKKVFKDVKSLSVIQIMSMLINFTDSIIISRFVGIIITGLYANYKMIITQLTSVVNAIYNSLGASIGNLVAEGNKEQIKKVLVNIEYFGFFLGSFCLCSLIYLFNPFIEIWQGRQYLMGVEIVLIISVNFYIFVQREVINYYLRTSGQHHKMVKPLAIEAIINLVLSIGLSFPLGLFGVLVGTLVSGLYGIFRTSRLLYRTYDISYWVYLKRQLKYIVIVLVELGLVYVVNYFVAQTNNAWIMLIVLAIAVVAVSLLVDLIILFKDKDIEYLKELFGNFVKKFIRRKEVHD